MHDDRAAVALEFEHVLAGKGIRPREEQRQPLVDGLTGGITEAGQRRVSRLQVLASQGDGEVGELAAGDSDDTDAAAPARGGDGGDALLTWRRQGLCPLRSCA